MPTTLSDAIRRVRSTIDEPSTQFWTDTEITDWINDGLRDLARRAEDLLTVSTSITVVANTSKYPLATDTIRVHRVEYVPTGSSQTYPLIASTYQEMDQVWGTNQGTPSSYPSYFVIFGYPGGTGTSAMQIQLFPVPAAGGTLNVFYYRLPYRFLDPIANPGELTKTLDVVEGWDDLVVTYAEWRAQRKNKDPAWQEAFQLYENQIDYLLNVTRQFHDQQRMITTASRVMQPSWLTEWPD